MFRNLMLSLPATSAILAAVALAARSPAELLEKAIYTEETMGDLDQAIQIYRQVVTGAQTAKASAAQAQYRLGQCLLKQKKTDEAVAAFKQVIDDYPDKTEWVAKARQHVPEQPQVQMGPVPWQDGEFQQLTVKLGGGLKIGSFVWSVESAKLEEQGLVLG